MNDIFDWTDSAVSKNPNRITYNFNNNFSMNFIKNGVLFETRSLDPESGNPKLTWNMYFKFAIKDKSNLIMAQDFKSVELWVRTQKLTKLELTTSNEYATATAKTKSGGLGCGVSFDNFDKSVLSMLLPQNNKFFCIGIPSTDPNILKYRITRIAWHVDKISYTKGELKFGVSVPYDNSIVKPTKSKELLDEEERYRSSARALTKMTERDPLFQQLCNPNGQYDDRSIWELDHILSINDAINMYKMNIPLEILVSIPNLEFIPKSANGSKGGKSYQTDVELIEANNKHVRRYGI